ncbi:CbbQ/NirQ/NorQ/GpvN family protein [Noviherbaspirillum sp. UKPF54]|uniref:CbbQ/NirQ/NorQ/GpvN family protein n=1 Tax=Noviherbaspirillum sp. UKPF54 TaxID=2601898 RepID=UPI0011B109DB|nr:CbbQ/NirQ/NorQ/GpvN family protein [Noviherbaspirillum sp. UKPF54]QDZ28006.1 CbbQ/NirQ/NorQ/GpvN family protein [Noviherbaspirillum sp. UKPF54]
MQALQERFDGEPFYLPQADEIEIFAQCHRQGLPVMLKGPTGCGKTRFVEHMAWRLGRPMVSVACHDDLTANDLLGRFLIRGDETVWQDGPVTQAVRRGAILYLDEVVEARPDTTVAIHPLSDHRRMLSLDKTGEVIAAAPGFQLVISYNPSYQHALKDLKPSTRQRFVALEFDFPDSAREVEIVAAEGGVDRACAVALVALAGRIRPLRDRGLAEAPSTRVLVAAARLIATGIPERKACEVAIAGPLTDDPTLIAAIRDLISGHFH